MHASLWAPGHRGRVRTLSTQSHQSRDRSRSKKENVLVSSAKRISDVDASTQSAVFNETKSWLLESINENDNIAASLGQATLTNKQHQEPIAKLDDGKPLKVLQEEEPGRSCVDASKPDRQPKETLPQRVTYDTERLLSVRSAAIEPRPFVFVPTADTTTKSRLFKFTPPGDAGKLQDVVSILARIAEEKRKSSVKANQTQEEPKDQILKTPIFQLSVPASAASLAGGSPSSLSASVAKLSLVDGHDDAEALSAIPYAPLAFTTPKAALKSVLPVKTEASDDKSASDGTDSGSIISNSTESTATKFLEQALDLINLLMKTSRRQDRHLMDALKIVKSLIEKTIAAIKATRLLPKHKTTTVEPIEPIEPVQEVEKDELIAPTTKSDKQNIVPTKIVDATTDESTSIVPSQPVSHTPAVKDGNPSRPPPQYIDFKIGTGRMPGKDKHFRCILCKSSNKVYKQLEALVQHCLSKHFQCEKCDVVFGTRNELIDHLTATGGQHNFCRLCSTDFETRESYLRHIIKTHPAKQELFICPGCRLAHKGPYQLVQHLESNLCRVITDVHFKQARIFTALIQRHSLGAIQDHSADERDAIKEQSIKLLRGGDVDALGPPISTKSILSPSFNSDNHKQEFPGGTIWICFNEECSAIFDKLEKFEDHLRAGHFTHGVCPSCHKEIMSPHKLLQHFIEGHKSCRMAYSSIFPYAVAAVSGGFVVAKPKGLPGQWTFTVGQAPNVKSGSSLPQASASK